MNKGERHRHRQHSQNHRLDIQRTDEFEIRSGLCSVEKPLAQVAPAVSFDSQGNGKDHLQHRGLFIIESVGARESWLTKSSPKGSANEFVKKIRLLQDFINIDNRIHNADFFFINPTEAHDLGMVDQPQRVLGRMGLKHHRHRRDGPAAVARGHPIIWYVVCDPHGLQRGFCHVQSINRTRRAMKLRQGLGRGSLRRDQGRERARDGQGERTARAILGERRVDRSGESEVGSASKLVQTCIEVIYLFLKCGDVIAHLIELAVTRSARSSTPVGRG